MTNNFVGNNKSKLFFICMSILWLQRHYKLSHTSERREWNNVIHSNLHSIGIGDLNPSTKDAGQTLSMGFNISVVY